jgi:hypothetical protein
MKNLKEGAPVTLADMKLLSTLKGSVDYNEEDLEPFDEETFKHYKLRWHIREYLQLSNNTVNVKVGNNAVKNKIIYMINLFHNKFNKYFIEYNKINKYNNLYKYKKQTYKIKVLRKINNLKIYYYFNNKRNKGLRFFDYINTFSIKYYLKHLL